MAKHIPALDGLRGIAALAVVVSHVLPQAHDHFHGEIGVISFFVLSGFLMTILYIDKPFEAASAKEFLFRRFARIAPIYWIVVVCSWALHKVLGSSSPYDMTDFELLRHLLFYGHIDVFWSIPPEIEFYLFFLLAWWSAASFRAGHQAPAGYVAALGVVAVGLSRLSPGIFLASKLHIFLAGCLVGFVRLHVAEQQHERVLPIAQWLGMAILLGFLLQGFTNWLCLYKAVNGIPTANVYQNLPVIVMCGALTFVASFHTGSLSKILGSVPLAYLGRISFSLYLTHRLTIAILGEGFGQDGVWLYLPLAFAAAAICHHLVERPSQLWILRTLGRLSSAAHKQGPGPTAKHSDPGHRPRSATT